MICFVSKKVSKNVWEVMTSVWRKHSKKSKEMFKHTNMFKIKVAPVQSGSADGGDGGVGTRPKHGHPPLGAVWRT